MQTLNMSQAAVTHMKYGSCIIMSGSSTSMWGSKHLLDYSMTKVRACGVVGVCVHSPSHTAPTLGCTAHVHAFALIEFVTSRHPCERRCARSCMVRVRGGAHCCLTHYSRTCRTPLNPSDKDAEEASKFGEHSSMKRAAQPEECVVCMLRLYRHCACVRRIAPAYVFLASAHCSSFITGEVRAHQRVSTQPLTCRFCLSLAAIDDDDDDVTTQRDQQIE
jgi:hypothetical protein